MAELLAVCGVVEGEEEEGEEEEEAVQEQALADIRLAVEAQKPYWPGLV